MEKIFDIAKDSEKSWGVIAQGIDGNFKEVEQALYGVLYEIKDIGCESQIIAIFTYRWCTPKRVCT